jgi:predicted alpha/beta superfamily hydrolase
MHEGVLSAQYHILWLLDGELARCCDTESTLKLVRDLPEPFLRVFGESSGWVTCALSVCKK